MKYLLSVLGILCLSNLIAAKRVNSEYILKSSNQVHHQFEILKFGNDAFKILQEILGLPYRIVDLIEVKENKNPGSNIKPKNEDNISTFMTDINGVTYICNTNADKTFSCIKIVLPTSCADSSSTACRDNKCAIRNGILGFIPFTVSCNNTVSGGGWTVIQRRINGSVNFLRDWDDYKHGFGDLDGEFWLGLDKIHALTTALEPMELLVELIDFDNVVKYAKYDSFAIGDEESQYLLQSLGNYSGDAGDALRYHERMKFSAKDRDNDNYVLDNCVNIREGGWWFDKCSMSNLNGHFYKAGTKPVPGAHNGVTWYLFHDSDYSMKSVQMMIRPRKN